ncbi:dipeptidase PepE [Thalassotalea sp. 1_MG-2023]|uniref:dipeptidase PepE n=1 Tax=Thalassotalea sp. 1_MG-2023 TaxID=3062680 RepID=UPI0026E1EDCA|nr:dipeptidase PepE [Thalassotalea sp. 1_MG-2023]MDO6428745.1 dipeptidase PepE [Thalassotalea sp. 1_MG-2023]
MENRDLLLLSSSKVGDTPYLSHALQFIEQHLAYANNIIFIPYAGIGMTYDEYTEKVNLALRSINKSVTSLHTFTDKKEAIENADAIIVGGGNTFSLLKKLYESELIDEIKTAVNSHGVKYIGWSAGANISGLSIKTTNDMPIEQPISFEALALVNCQLNPHYSEYKPPGFNGETREQRLTEFMTIEPETLVIGLVEGSALQVKGKTYQYLTADNIDQPLYLFKGGIKRSVLTAPDNLDI